MTSAFQDAAPNPRKKTVIIAAVAIALVVMFLGFCLSFIAALQNTPKEQEPKVPDSCMRWTSTSSLAA